ncbi:MAG: hypothetical protein SV062_04760, partial [Thermodesulfobacteriota bacterium]|nr:hypothetical protein [Thermodesulfobacteriota bacterium]
TEILMSITPHIVRNITIPARDAISIWSGTSDVYSSKEPFSSFIESPLSKRKEKAEDFVPDFKIPEKNPFLRPERFKEKRRRKAD